MSLINKMLQDLDARGPQAGAPMQGEVKSVARADARVSPGVAVGAIALAVLVGVGGVLGWRVWKRPAAPAVAAQAAVSAPRPAAAPLAVAPPVALGQGAAVASPSPAPEIKVAVATAAAPASAHGTVPAPGAAKATPARAKAAPVQSTAAKRKAKRDETQQLATNKRVAPSAPRRVARGAAPSSVATVAAVAGASAIVGGRDMTGAQKAESEYRRAMLGLQEGRVAEAIAALEQALKLEPRHDAARQTLVGLLVEAKRPDEAIRLLQNGLTLEPRQPGMAMLLARLQIERGGNGIDTLMRSLPYAGGNGDYHAFLAGALQRQARHRESAEQYRAALQAVPQQGVWWMGLGISLQADKRDGEAQSAFQRARDSGTLNADLQAFVDRRLQQLAR
jgi:MSHA biogenesis protein MshN